MALRLQLLKFFELVLPLSFLMACQGDQVFDQVSKMGEKGWLQKNQISYPFEIKKIDQSYTLYVAIRQSNDYPFNNFYFVPKILGSNGQVIKQALAEAILYDPKSGKAKGKGLGDMYSHKFAIFKQLKFPKKGKYTLLLSHDMRTDTLAGIISVGASLIPNP
ncbi:gliding motility lipoprotein GldH [Aquirufa rosea]|nr:gliding motility lipoprotein GldH [Aquirufa rosea]